MPLLTDPVVAPGTLARVPQPVIDLGDLVLRPWHEGDAPAVAAAFADPDIRRWHARSMSEDEARAWIAAWPGQWAGESGASWAVADESTLLGQVGLRRLRLADGSANVSYWVLPAVRGRRVARRALSALTAWAFDDLGLHRLELNHSTLNPASCRVAAAGGYLLEGIKRREALHADGWHDMHLHARLTDDPREVTPASG